MGHNDAVVVLTTLATSEEAVKFVKALLERRLVACGTILPGTRSLYRWEDKLADETEVVVRSLRTGEQTTVVANAMAPRYLSSGHLLYVRGGVLFAGGVGEPLSHNTSADPLNGYEPIAGMP